MGEEKLKYSDLLIVAIVSGFTGGLMGTTLSLQIFKSNDRLMELLLNWPFLSFVLVIFIVTIFYSSIKQLISKRNFKIKVGDNEFSTVEVIEQEVSGQLEDQFSTIDEQVSNITNDSPKIAKIKEIFNIQSNEFANIIFHLGASKFKWRSLKALSKRTGLNNEKIDQYVISNPELIIRSIGIKSGNGIYRLNDEKQLLFEEIINKTI